MSWKQKLISSGMPFEHDVAQALVKSDYFVRSEFEFLRKSEEGYKEFSVDFSATYFKEIDFDIKYSLELLVECKHSSKDKSVILFEAIDHQEGCVVTLGHTLAKIDVACPDTVSDQPIYDFEARFKFVNKIIEISEKDADPKRFKHGCQQLRYAAVPFVFDILEWQMSEHPKDVHPRYVAKILVTNAPLRTISEGVRLVDIESAEKIEDISEEVPAAIIVMGHGSEIKDHTRRYAENISERFLSLANHVEEDMKNAGKHFEFDSDKPLNFIENLLNHKDQMSQFVDQIFIVNIKHLDEFFSSICTVADASFSTRIPASK